VTKTLRPPSGGPILLKPVTTAKFAKRMRAGLQTATKRLPTGLREAAPLDILLALHVAEEDADYPDVDRLTSGGLFSRPVVERWLWALEQHGLVDRSDELLALSSHGHDVVSGILEAVYRAQRDLD
jgi:hypothetical protein